MFKKMILPKPTFHPTVKVIIVAKNLPFVITFFLSTPISMVESDCVAIIGNIKCQNYFVAKAASIDNQVWNMGENHRMMQGY